MNEQKPNQLWIFKRKKGENGVRDTFEFAHRVVTRDIPMFTQVSMNFHFKAKPGMHRDTILFAKIDQVFSINFETEEINTIYTFKQKLLRQPQFFKPNDEQKIFLVE